MCSSGQCNSSPWKDTNDSKTCKTQLPSLFEGNRKAKVCMVKHIKCKCGSKAVLAILSGWRYAYLGSVMRRISLHSRPMKVADSSTGGYLGIGICVDWYTLCQSWIWKGGKHKHVNMTTTNNLQYYYITAWIFININISSRNSATGAQH